MNDELNEIFKAYDVRGIYPTQIDEKLIEMIGRAFADFVDGDNIAVGFDCRVSSPKLFASFVNGILLQGKNVLSFGLTSTPMSYYACCKLNADGCAMITASHNPKEYNGVKFTLKNASPISEDTGLNIIKEKILKKDFKIVQKKGTITNFDVKKDYAKFVSNFIKTSLSEKQNPNSSNKTINTINTLKDAFLEKTKKNKLKVVVDPANGMGSQDYLLVLDKLFENNIGSDLIFFEIDGTYPNHDANPMKEGALDVLKKRVLDTKSDLGIAFDGDADRVFFVDDKGNQISSDLISALLSENFLDSKNTILYDLRSSKVVKEVIESLGGIAKETRVGHSFIKKMMKDTNAVFAGELSGHFYFKFDKTNSDINSIFDSGIIGAIILMNILKQKDEPLSKLLEPLSKYYQSGEINSIVENKDEKLELLEQTFKSGKISKIDGIKISFDDWWFNVRASNTEPLLRLNLEADTKELMQEKKELILKIIRTKTNKN